jgi:hypothetical protein
VRQQQAAKPMRDFTNDKLVSNLTLYAYPRCTKCHGYGLVAGRALGSPPRQSLRPCKCSLRRIFLNCLNHYYKCLYYQVSGMQSLSHNGKFFYDFKREEFIVDFLNLSSRALRPSGKPSLRFEIFKNHFILNKQWKECCNKLNLERGLFFHELYRAEEELGYYFLINEPYSIFPIGSYYNRSTNSVIVKDKNLDHFIGYAINLKKYIPKHILPRHE